MSCACPGSRPTRKEERGVVLSSSVLKPTVACGRGPILPRRQKGRRAGGVNFAISARNKRAGAPGLGRMKRSGMHHLRKSTPPREGGRWHKDDGRSVFLAVSLSRITERQLPISASQRRRCRQTPRPHSCSCHWRLVARPDRSSASKRSWPYEAVGPWTPKLIGAGLALAFHMAQTGPPAAVRYDSSSGRVCVYGVQRLAQCWRRSRLSARRRGLGKERTRGVRPSAAGAPGLVGAAPRSQSQRYYPVAQ